MIDCDPKARPFIKMHGLGNDFVVLDARHAPLALTGARARAIADRRYGIGCDQIVVLRPSDRADVAVEFYNSDGGRVAACGNASRCVADLLYRQGGGRRLLIESDAGILIATVTDDGRFCLDMGEPGLAWQDIPLSRACDTLAIPLSAGPLKDPVAVSMGNPHAVFFVDDQAAIDFPALAPALEVDPLFPERANISVASIDGGRIDLMVWERGAGLTRACGTGACAAAVAAARRGLAGRRVTVRLPGGLLDIAWGEDNHVRMTGPSAMVFAGTIDVAALEPIP